MSARRSGIQNASCAYLAQASESTGGVLNQNGQGSTHLIFGSSPMNCLRQRGEDLRRSSGRLAGLDAELARMRHRKQELDLELKRLTDSIAQGQQSQSIMNAIGEREKELRAITDKLLEPAPGSLRAKLEELREFAVSRLTKIRELLARPENIQEAHEALAERVGQLTLA